MSEKKIKYRTKGRDNTTLYWVLLVLVLLFFSQMRTLRKEVPLQTGGQAGTHGDAYTIPVKPPLSEINIDRITFDQGVIRISGKAGLPDGSVLSLFLLDTGEASVGYREEVKTEVNGCSFYGVFSPSLPDKKLWGRFLINVVFDPKEQPDNVVSVIGINGEKLDNDKAVNIGGTWMIMAAGELTLSPYSDSYSLPEISSYPLDSPERTAAAFLRCWKERHWKNMMNYTSVSFRDRIAESHEYLEGLFMGKDLINAEIQKVIEVAENEVRVIIDIELIVDGQQRKARLNITGVREFTIWGLDPHFAKQL